MRIIGGRLGGRCIKVVESAGLRPATGRVREALFSMLEARGLVFAGAKVLDLFAGSGGVGIEALSRGAPLAVFVERAPAVVKVLRENLAALGLGPEQARVVAGEVAKVLPKLAGQAFDLVAIDPPYGQGLAGPTLEGLLATGLLAPQAMVVAEVEADLDLAALAPQALECLVDRTYGQTRIIIWVQRIPAWPSIPEPSIP
jgi:16S rRNA (guanine966-N2)-methyltransferase